MPWYPFFQKIEQADKFILLKECQFEKNSFTNRFDSAPPYKGPHQWNTMSVNKGLEPIKNKKYLNPEKDWERIKNNLPEYEEILSSFDECISSSLLHTNTCIIIKICDMLRIDTEIVFDYLTELKATDRLVDLCNHYGGTEYLTGSGGSKSYLDLCKFGDVKVKFKKRSNDICILDKLKELLTKT